MELHAWFNPYRAVKNVDDYIVSDFHISRVHPEWILNFENYKMLDPGIPKVKEYIASIVEEVIKDYDVDGIHFDDYFYPYSPKVSNEDSVTFSKYGNSFSNIDDWRRYNINSMVALVSEKINAIKPYIKFGISPFGIVENKYAGTNGFNSYSILYCDPLNLDKG
ncbi:MAG: family 10 glycosylhydrolase [Ignavibacteriales bacterium]|nr:family 10 glycosylhydrolase [Ignavibacteriales bacterium]